MEPAEGVEPEDLARLLATRSGGGADYWSTPDHRLGIERPISTLTALMILSELRVPPAHEAVRGAAQLVLEAIDADGHAHIAPRGTVYPCHTALSAAVLARNGYAPDPRVRTMLAHLLASRFDDGGWRCRKFLYGRGPETGFSNPGVTLFALDAFRCAGLNDDPDLDAAVETLLRHWTVRVPTGPCHHGIGSLFMQVEYPFLRYNYVYVLAFYPRARTDERFLAALAVLTGKLDSRAELIVERPNRRLEQFRICRRGEPSAAATRRYQEIIANLQPRPHDPAGPGDR